MGRDNTGKKQEDAQLAQQNATAKAAVDQTNKRMAETDTDISHLTENGGGYSPEDLAGMRASSADTISGAYGGAEDQMARQAVATGHENDAGLYPQMLAMERAKVRDATSKALDYENQNASEKLATRRMVPSLRMGTAQLYNTTANDLSGINSNMIQSRMNVDNSPTFLQQAALAGISGASQVGAAAAGKPPCWIAEALYGVDAIQTHTLRYWLTEIWEKRSFVGRIVVGIYRRVGERVAKLVREYPIVRRILQPLFDRALARANRELGRV